MTPQRDYGVCWGAASARVAKDQARGGVEAALRPLAKFIQADPATTDADRARLGITVRSQVGRASRPPPSRPRLTIDVATRLTHTVLLIDDATPTRRAMPRGVQRAELFVALTDPHEAPPPPPPIDEPGGGAYQYLGSFTRFPATLTFDPDRAGQQAHYLARWASARGGPGGWSIAASAGVAA